MLKGEVKKAYMAAYYEANRERRKEYNAAYYAANKERLKAKRVGVSKSTRTKQPRTPAVLEAEARYREKRRVLREIEQMQFGPVL